MVREFTTAKDTAFNGVDCDNRRPGGPYSKRQPSPAGLGNREHKIVASAVGAVPNCLDIAYDPNVCRGLRLLVRNRSS